MKTLRQAFAIFSATLMLAPVMSAQQYSWQTRQHSWLTDPYRPKRIAPLNLANSNRLESLLRAGNLYLSLQDAIALALENNLDVELSRYGPQIAGADLLRAKAGGLLRGVPQTVQLGPERQPDRRRHRPHRRRATHRRRGRDRHRGRRRCDHSDRRGHAESGPEHVLPLQLGPPHLAAE